MSDHEEGFAPETRDERPEGLLDLLPVEEAPLVDALQKHYRPTMEWSAHTLEQARERILRSRQGVLAQEQSAGHSYQHTRKMHERTSCMQFEKTVPNNARKLSKLLSFVVAAVFIGLL